MPHDERRTPTAHDKAVAEERETRKRFQPVRCDCSLSWRYRKGHGSDPAHCQIHGDAPTEPASEVPDA